MLKGIWKLLSGAAFCLYDWAFWREISGVNLAELSQSKWLLETYLSLRGSDPISTCYGHSGVTSALNSYYDSTASPRWSLVIPLQLKCLLWAGLILFHGAMLLGSLQEWWYSLGFNPILPTFQLELFFHSRTTAAILSEPGSVVIL